MALKLFKLFIFSQNPNLYMKHQLYKFVENPTNSTKGKGGYKIARIGSPKNDEKRERE